MKQKFQSLMKDGGALYGLQTTLAVARAGITSKGRVWLLIGETPLLLPKLEDWQESGCGLAATGSNREKLYLVKPEDADDMQYGALLDSIAEARGQTSEADCLRLLGDDA